MIKLKHLHYLSWRSNAVLLPIVILIRFAAGWHLTQSGLQKIVGDRMLMRSSSADLLQLLDGFFQLGFYWHWVGLMELLTAFLLLSQSLPAFAALMCFFFSFNVGLLGISVGWGSIMMQISILLASILLLAWDFHLFRPLFNMPACRNREPLPEAGRKSKTVGIFIFVLGIAIFTFKQIVYQTG